jgi:hypothetical protein
MMYDPDAAPGARMTTLATSSIHRFYHSTALLLPSGDIWVAGSEQGAQGRAATGWGGWQAGCRPRGSAWWGRHNCTQHTWHPDVAGRRLPAPAPLRAPHNTHAAAPLPTPPTPAACEEIPAVTATLPATTAPPPPPPPNLPPPPRPPRQATASTPARRAAPRPPARSTGRSCCSCHTPSWTAPPSPPSRPTSPGARPAPLPPARPRPPWGMAPVGAPLCLSLSLSCLLPCWEPPPARQPPLPAPR